MLMPALRLTTARRFRAALCLAAFLTGMTPTAVFAAGERAGQVTFAGVVVPGATVTATQGDKKLVTSTDTDGAFKFTELGDGVWSIRIETSRGGTPMMHRVALPGVAM